MRHGVQKQIQHSTEQAAGAGGEHSELSTRQLHVFSLSFDAATFPGCKRQIPALLHHCHEQNSGKILRHLSEVL